MCVLLSLPGSPIVHSSTCLDSNPLLTAFSSILPPNQAFLGSPCKRSPYNLYHWISRKTSTKLKIKAHGLIHRLSAHRSLSSTQKAHTKIPLGCPQHDTFRCPRLCTCCFLCMNHSSPTFRTFVTDRLCATLFRSRPSVHIGNCQLTTACPYRPGQGPWLHTPLALYSLSCIPPLSV